MENTRGLSAIVATLIIILLTLVAVGIIWVVIRNVINSGTEDIKLSAKCTAVNLEAVSVNEIAAGNYSVTLHRNAGGDELGGVKVAIFNVTKTSGVKNFGVTISALDTKTATIDTGGNVTNGNKIEYTPFFIDASGNEQLCPHSTQTFPF